MLIITLMGPETHRHYHLPNPKHCLLMTLLVGLEQHDTRADCSTADEPGQVPHVGGLSNFGK
ncbi:hypothetical protein PV325_011252, partial [Microctonus aethiopoides]